MFKCYLCNSSDFIVKNKGTRDRKGLRVLQCQKCSLTFLETFKHLASISYEDGANNEIKVNSANDYKKILNDNYRDDSRRFLQFKKIIKNKIILDFGSGAGGFLRLAAKVAKRACGVEIDKIIRFYNKRVPVESKIDNFNFKFDVITLFHVLEHMPDPVNFLKNIKKYLRKGGKIIIEVPNDNDALISQYKLQSFKDFTYWSLHLYSYNHRTLEKICKKAGFKKVKIDFFQRYNLANHIGWLKDGKPGGQNRYPQFNKSDSNRAYTEQLEKKGACDTLIAVLQN